MAGSLENRGKLRELIDKFQFVCMINLNSILATYPEWGQKVPPLSLFGGEKRPRYSKVTPFCAPVF
jgi:hypothetical protein